MQELVSHAPLFINLGQLQWRDLFLEGDDGEASRFYEEHMAQLVAVSVVTSSLIVFCTALLSISICLSTFFMGVSFASSVIIAHLIFNDEKVSIIIGILVYCAA